jgi:gluconokinase
VSGKADGRIHVIVVMGVAGAGKSTVGRALSDALCWTFYDGDDFHPAANIEKMRQGHPLTDSDRRPWLETLNGLVADVVPRSARLFSAQGIVSRRDPSGRS